MSIKSLSEITERYATSERAIIAIDGPAGAGKTTLAKRIASSVKRTTLVIHMDDLYEGWNLALTSKLTRTLTNQILAPAREGKNFGYRKYNWFARRFGETGYFQSPQLLIIEGVGSGQKAAGKYLDDLIWIDIEPEVGLKRVLSRDGDYLTEEMLIWQLREQEHFRVENTRDRATIRLDGNFFI